MALSKSAKYFRDNPKARAKKKAYDTEFGKKPEQRAKRSELIKINREADKKGVNRKGKDFDHGSNSYISSSVNRGKSTGTVGDRNARGRGSKKKRNG